MSMNPPILYVVCIDFSNEVAATNALQAFEYRLKLQIIDRPQAERAHFWQEARRVGLLCYHPPLGRREHPPWVLLQMTQEPGKYATLYRSDRVEEVKAWITRGLQGEKLALFHVDAPSSWLRSLFYKGEAFHGVVQDFFATIPSYGKPPTSHKPEDIVNYLLWFWQVRHAKSLTPSHAPSPYRGAWRVQGASQKGRTHTETGKDNQDALFLPANATYPVLVAVADGHGNARHFRSEKGSQFAVEAVSQAWKRLQSSVSDPENLAEIKSLAEQQLPRWIVEIWRERVKEHGRNTPFSEQEKALISGNYYAAYGSTLVALILEAEFRIYVQIGDGDILDLYEDGIVQRALPEDEQNDGVATTSLCLPEAWNLFRIQFRRHTGKIPLLTLLATDGYANSYGGRAEDFYKVAKDYWKLICERGEDYVQTQLPLWLRETTDKGAGDDITVALVYRESYRAK